MLTKSKIIIFLSLISVVSIILLNTNYVNGNLPQSITQILTNSGYVSIMVDGNVSSFLDMTKS